MSQSTCSSAAAQRIWLSESCSSQQASWRHGRIPARGRLHPFAAHRHDRHRSARAAHVRADAPRGDRRVRRIDRRALGQARRRLGSRVPRRGVGCRGRDRRRPALPRPNELERGAGPEVEGHLRGLEGRPRRVGRNLPRLRRRRDRRQALGRERDQDDGRGGARVAARPGRRANRQLVQPGAVREADRPGVGAQDRHRPPRPGLRAVLDLPPDVPLRADLRPVDGRGAAPDRSAVADSRTRVVRALRVLLHVRAVLRGAAADRSRAPRRRAAAERVGVADPVRAVDGVLHLVAVLRRDIQVVAEWRLGGGRRPRAEDGHSTWPRPTRNSVCSL